MGIISTATTGIGITGIIQVADSKCGRFGGVGAGAMQESAVIPSGAMCPRPVPPADRRGHHPGPWLSQRVRGPPSPPCEGTQSAGQVLICVS
jgi:hypothetical protein